MCGMVFIIPYGWKIWRGFKFGAFADLIQIQKLITTNNNYKFHIEWVWFVHPAVYIYMCVHCRDVSLMKNFNYSTKVASSNSSRDPVNLIPAPKKNLLPPILNPPNTYHRQSNSNGNSILDPADCDAPPPKVLASTKHIP